MADWLRGCFDDANADSLPARNSELDCDRTLVCTEAALLNDKELPNDDKTEHTKVLISDSNDVADATVCHVGDIKKKVSISSRTAGSKNRGHCKRVRHCSISCSSS